MDTFLSREVKFSAGTGEVSGYGSVFNNIDLGNDRIAPGAFSRTLADRKSLPMLFGHDPNSVVGVWDQLSEDDHGLKVSGRISDTTLGRDARTLAKDGAVSGLSIGYQATKAKHDREGVRVIEEAELWEVSLVAMPMNPLARLQSVKRLIAEGEVPEQKDVAMLLRHAGFSRRATKRLMQGGYTALTQSELTELAQDLRQLRTEIRR